MKKIALSIVFITSTLTSLAQYREPRGRYYESDNIGLPSFEFTGKGLLLGAVLFLIGYIAYAVNKKSNNEGSLFGGICMALGFVCCIPAIAWLQAIIGSIYMIGVILVVIIGGGALLWDYIKKKT